MTEEPGRVVAVVRHREAVLVRDGTDGTRTLPTAEIEPGGTGDALEALVDRLGLDGTVERRGAAVGGLVPFLVGTSTREVGHPPDCHAPTWEPPAVLRRQDDDRWWRAYEGVAPSVATIAADAERGSTAIAVDALWTLRDAATIAAARGDGVPSVGSVAADLIESRPAMAALGNRINRAMAAGEHPAEIEAAATRGIVRAFEADAAAARLAAETIDGGHVLTLSRSGTVREALLEAGPAVDVLASRPGGEGVAVAEELRAAGLSVSVVADAAVYERLRTGEIDAVLVGADAVTPDGGVVNKVGTWAAAHAATLANVPCDAVCASDKVVPAGADAPIETLFDLTPPAFVTAILTERGRLTPGDVEPVADEHRALGGWRQ